MTYEIHVWRETLIPNNLSQYKLYVPGFSQLAPAWHPRPVELPYDSSRDLPSLSRKVAEVGFRVMTTVKDAFSLVNMVHYNSETTGERVDFDFDGSSLRAELLPKGEFAQLEMLVRSHLEALKTSKGKPQPELVRRRGPIFEPILPP